MRFRQTLDELRTLLDLPVEEAAKPAAAWKKIKAQATDDLNSAGLDGNKSFKTFGAAMNAITAALDKNGIELDDVPSADLFKGDSGRRTMRLAWSNPDDAFSPESIGNSMLSIQWSKHQSGNYEVTAYLS